MGKPYFLPQKEINGSKHSKATFFGRTARGLHRMWNRVRWAEGQSYTVSHYVIPNGSEHDEIFSREHNLGWGPSHILHITKTHSRSFWTMDLTDFTEDEIRAISNVIKTALDQALEVCILRDNKAKELFDVSDLNAEESALYARIYRPVPVEIDRSGAFEEHDEGVQG